MPSRTAATVAAGHDVPPRGAHGAVGRCADGGHAGRRCRAPARRAMRTGGGDGAGAGGAPGCPCARHQRYGIQGHLPRDPRRGEPHGRAGRHPQAGPSRRRARPPPEARPRAMPNTRWRARSNSSTTTRSSRRSRPPRGRDARQAALTALLDTQALLWWIGGNKHRPLLVARSACGRSRCWSRWVESASTVRCARVSQGPVGPDGTVRAGPQRAASPRPGAVASPTPPLHPSAATRRCCCQMGARVVLVIVAQAAQPRRDETNAQTKESGRPDKGVRAPGQTLIET